MFGQKGKPPNSVLYAMLGIYYGFCLNVVISLLVFLLNMCDISKLATMVVLILMEIKVHHVDN